MIPLTLVALALLPTIWIVDASNGPGTNFVDLPAAVAAAASGDTIIVRAGSYTTFQSTGKALTIRGAGASSTAIVGTPWPITETTISGVPAGMTFYMSGLQIAPVWASGGSPTFYSALRVLGPGTVVFADVTILGAAMSGGGTGGLFVSNGAEVHLSRSSVSGGNVFGQWDLSPSPSRQALSSRPTTRP